MAADYEHVSLKAELSMFILCFDDHCQSVWLTACHLFIKPAAARDSESGLMHRCYPSVRLSPTIFSRTNQFIAMVWVSIDDL